MEDLKFLSSIWECFVTFVLVSFVLSERNVVLMLLSVRYLWSRKVTKGVISSVLVLVGVVGDAMSVVLCFLWKWKMWFSNGIWF